MKRTQIVSYAPGVDTKKPMIRLANNFLLRNGFRVGSKIEIDYSDGIITITLKTQEYDHTQPVA
jgi:hypothetical protein